MTDFSDSVPNAISDWLYDLDSLSSDPMDLVDVPFRLLSSIPNDSFLSVLSFLSIEDSTFSKRSFLLWHQVPTSCDPVIRGKREHDMWEMFTNSGLDLLCDHRHGPVLLVIPRWWMDPAVTYERRHGWDAHVDPRDAEDYDDDELYEVIETSVLHSPSRFGLCLLGDNCWVTDPSGSERMISPFELESLNARTFPMAGCSAFLRMSKTLNSSTVYEHIGWSFATADDEEQIMWISSAVGRDLIESRLTSSTPQLIDLHCQRRKSMSVGLNLSQQRVSFNNVSYFMSAAGGGASFEREPPAITNDLDCWRQSNLLIKPGEELIYEKIAKEVDLIKVNGVGCDEEKKVDLVPSKMFYGLSFPSFIKSVLPIEKCYIGICGTKTVSGKIWFNKLSLRGVSMLCTEYRKETSRVS